MTERGKARPAEAARRNGARARQTMRNDVTSAIICLLSFDLRAKNVGTGQGESEMCCTTRLMPACLLFVAPFVIGTNNARRRETGQTTVRFRWWYFVWNGFISVSTHMVLVLADSFVFFVAVQTLPSWSTVRNRALLWMAKRANEARSSLIIISLLIGKLCRNPSITCGCLLVQVWGSFVMVFWE